MSALTHRVEFRPGYSKRAEGYGVHGMEIAFIMTGPKGAVQFVLNTGWVPGEPMSARVADLFPLAVDLGYHWRSPRYPEQSQWARDDCLYLDGAPCYYDGSGLNAERVLPLFIEGGEDAVWDELDDYYRHLVETEDDWLADAITGGAS